MVRHNTATGEVWFIGAGDEAVWKRSPEVPGAEPIREPGGTPNRYELRIFNLKGVAFLFRLDGETGQAWRLVLGEDMPWTPLAPLAEDYARRGALASERSISELAETTAARREAEGAEVAAADELEKILRGDADPKIRAFAAMQLADLDPAVAVPRLNAALIDGEDSEVLMAVARALGQLGGPEVVAPLERASRFSDPALRKVAEEELAHLR